MPAPRRNQQRMRYLAIASMALLAASAQAQTPLQSAREYFQVVDADHDGRLSLSEYQSWMTRAFHAMDSNQDNVLEPHEQLVPNSRSVHLSDLHNRLAVQFHRQDRNHDGWLNAKEYLAPPQ